MIVSILQLMGLALWQGRGRAAGVKTPTVSAAGPTIRV